MQPQFTTKDVERFWSHVDKSGDCWLWTGCTLSGYGYFSVGNKDLRAHRFAYIISYGPLPDEKPYVCHSCDINYPIGDPGYRRCVRPEHLFAGTHADNFKDAVSKGRMASGQRHGTHTHPERVAKGERQGKAKLTADDVSVIRQLRASGLMLQTIAARYEVSESCIWNIELCRTWKHVL